MNFGILPEEMLEAIHEAISEANDEPEKHAIEGDADWKEWRDNVEQEMKKREIDFDHIVLAGEETEDEEDDDEEDEDKDKAKNNDD